MGIHKRFDGGMNRRNFLVCGASGLALAACATPLPSTSGDPTRVATTGGVLNGLAPEAGVVEFLGVRYAKPPVGDLRFQAPQPIARSSDEIIAQNYGEAAVQLRAGAGAASYPPGIQAAMTEAFMPPENIAPGGDEDCLFLNVYAPDDGPGSLANRPVMVWLHGGGFSYGQAGLNIYRGRNLAKKHDVVFVGVNHRLNVFGYLGLDSAGVPGFEGSANAGMLDIVEALNWVRQNIANFGGDPENVTIFGQSGGGAKVSTLLAMPEADGLFDKAIIQSGAGLRSGTMQSAAETAREFLAELNISPANAADELKNVPTETVLATAVKMGGRNFRPSIDGQHIPRHPFSPDAPDQSADIPVMIGYTKDERTLYNVGNDDWYNTSEEDVLEAANAYSSRAGKAIVDEFRSMYPDYDAKNLLMQVSGTIRSLSSSHTLAARKSAQRAPVYSFVFAHDLPPQDFLLKSPHTAEIPYIMDNVEEAPLFAGATPDDFAMADLMSNIWTSFARTGNPNVPGLPDWPEFTPETRATMFLSTQSELVTNPYPVRCAAIRANQSES